MQFDLLLKSQLKGESIPSRLLAFDPGETTGLAFFLDGELHTVDQLETKTMLETPKVLKEAFKKYNPDIVVFEEYRIYGWKTEVHSWSDLHTPRVIGAIETICALSEESIPYTRQSAQQPKSFCTDMKLKQWDFYKKGVRHGRDAVRHGCFYLLFNHSKKSTRAEQQKFRDLYLCDW